MRIVLWCVLLACLAWSLQGKLSRALKLGSSDRNGYSVNVIASTERSSTNNSSTTMNSNSDVPNSDNASTATSSSEPVKRASFFNRLNLVDNFFANLFSYVTDDPDIIRFLSNISTSIFWVFVLLSTVGTIGVDTKPIISLLSVAGITVGFALKNILADSFSGVYFVFLRPFRYGSVISVNGLKGRVLSLDVRYVTLQSVSNKNEIFKIPTSSVSKATIILDKPASADYSAEI